MIDCQRNMIVTLQCQKTYPLPHSTVRNSNLPSNERDDLPFWASIHFLEFPHWETFNIISSSLTLPQLMAHTPASFEYIFHIPSTGLLVQPSTSMNAMDWKRIPDWALCPSKSIVYMMMQRSQLSMWNTNQLG